MLKIENILLDSGKKPFTFLFDFLVSQGMKTENNKQGP
jgi:hypothetical protein